MATLTADGRREEQSVEHNRLARSYLESRGVKLAWIRNRVEHYECGCIVGRTVGAGSVSGPEPCAAHWAAIYRLIGNEHVGRQADYL
jgi:hypothetical protein